MNNQEAIKILDKERQEYIAKGCKLDKAVSMAIEALKKQTVYEQVKWERDMALQTLEEHGIGLGQRCLLNDIRRERGKFHGLSDTRVYRIWKDMIQRCTNPNSHSYENYGAKGIAVCDEWQGEQGFYNFLSWSLNNGYADNLTIDRIDGEKGYFPQNCRWADWNTQRRNQKREFAVNQYGKFPLRATPTGTIQGE